jgi:parvulin-like peptidyl-prolyl isomerase
MRTNTFLSILIFLLIGGCRNSNQFAESERIATTRRIAASKAAGEAVLVVSGEVITSSEILESPVEMNGAFVSPIEHLKPFAKKSAPEEFQKEAWPIIEKILMNEISGILLYHEAKRNTPKNIDEALEKAAETEVRKFFMEFGGDEAKAEEKLKQLGMNRQKLKENRKRFILTQWYISSRLLDNKPVTHTELIECYNRMKEQSFLIPARLEFRLIDIQPIRPKIADPNQTSASSVEADPLEQARKLANELVKQIEAGRDFGELAKQYSHGHRREFGGLWEPVQPESLAKPYDILAVEAEKIDPGQVAGPIEMQGHIFIMKLEDKCSKGFQPFEKVQEQLKQKIISDRQREALDKLDAEFMQNLEPDKMDEFIDSCLDKIYQIRKDPQ